MSRYSTQIDKYEIVVGWDPPLLTYFGQIHDTTLPEDEQIITWRGTGTEELYEIDDLVLAIARYFRGDPVLQARVREWICGHSKELYRDKDEGL